MEAKIFKVITILLLIMVIIAQDAGCTVLVDNPKISESSGSTEPPKHAMSATLKIVLPSNEPAAQKQVNNAISAACKKSGLDFTFDYTYVPWDAYPSTINLIAASGEEYDLAWTYITSIGGLVAAKVLAPLDDALKNYGQELVKVTPPYAFKEVTFNGKIYAIPRFVPQADNNNNIVIRADLRKKYGLAPLKTISDMENFAADVQKNEKGMFPIGINTDQIMRGIANYWFWDTNSYIWCIAINPTDPKLKVFNFLETEEFQQFCEKTRQYQKNGWMVGGDYDLANYLNDFDNGKFAMLNSGIMRLSEIIDGFKAAQPNGELEWVQLYPEKPTYIFVSNDNLLSVFSTSKHVNEAVAFINWARTNQENYDLLSYGVKDRNYKLDGESVNVDGIAKENMYNPLSWTWTDIRFMRFSRYLGKDYTDLVKSWDKKAAPSPIAGFNFDPEPVRAEVATILAVASEYRRTVMWGLADFSSYRDALLKKMKDAGIDKIIAEMQKQLDAYKANQ